MNRESILSLLLSGSITFKYASWLMEREDSAVRMKFEGVRA